MMSSQNRQITTLMMSSSLLVVAAALLAVVGSGVEGFTTTRIPFATMAQRSDKLAYSSAASPSALNVWWFGGTDNSEVNEDGDSCELVAVRIERTSSNSRKIAGSITVATPLADVWAILTDYNRLSIHVPNLVESRIVSQQSQGEMGDGSFRCKLFQKGAQKIVGFEFGASLTMQMTESIITHAGATSSSDESADALVLQERVIGFKCLDSFFFSGFDGEWRAKEQINVDGEIETVLDYTVDVRPKGPVPVAALEWRIREDVPTNLRAVKKAALEVGLEGVLASRQRVSRPATRRIATQTSSPPQQRVRPATSAANNGTRQPRKEQQPQVQTTNAIRRATIRGPRLTNPLMRRSRQGAEQPAAIMASTQQQQLNKNRAERAANKPRQTTEKKKNRLPFKVIWEADETMAAYLGES